MKLGGLQGNGIAISVQYSSMENRLIPTLVETSDIDGMRRRFEFNSIEFEPTPRSEFTLDFYGLAEAPSDGPAPSRRSWLFWLGGLAVFGFGLAFLLRSLADRRPENGASRRGRGSDNHGPPG